MPKRLTLPDTPFKTTPRGMEAYNLIKGGMTLAEAAQKMGIARNTVYNYIFMTCTPSEYEKKLRYQRAYAKTPKGRASIIRSSRAWEKCNPEKAKTMRREAWLRYQRDHPEKLTQYKNRYLAGKYIKDLSPDALDILDKLLPQEGSPP